MTDDASDGSPEPDADGSPEAREPEVPDVVARAEAEAPDSPADDEVEPVEVLVQLARDGEIDPWDVDIVAVTDAFLARIEAADLRTSARALFYASVLLRMKGDALMGVDEPDESDDEPEQPPAAAPGGDPVEALEAEMDRRLERQHVRGSPETLDELVRELRDRERRHWWKESRTYDTSGSPSGFRRGTQTLDYHAGDEGRMTDEPTEAEVTGTAHEEDIEATIEDVDGALAERFDRGRSEVLYEEIADTGGTRVKTFLALLFLAHRGSVYLEQDELFDDLWVSRA